MESYYIPDHLANFSDIGEGNGELARKFFDYYASVFADGALTVREKALIALAVSHAVQCPYCIDAYSTECVHQGADLEEMTEAVHVATAIRGGASLVHGLQMLEHVTKSSMSAQQGSEDTERD
ncbi:MAG: arsenosugar biosynthesis-associated peroxidase-like protein [Acidobacteriota bacterium]|nr:arsenosugar biosynthesis-associated peroxidase-like protein [Acidobacteriota bacterium]